MIKIKYLSLEKEWRFIEYSFSNVQSAKNFITHNLVPGNYKLYVETVKHDYIEDVTKS